MDKYEYLSVIGQGSYGKVIKCRHKESGQLVAIKKFIETEEDLAARKMALREIRMLKKLRHDNLVSMLEVFRRKKRFHLVFEYMAQTLLDKFEHTRGLSEELTRKYTFQIIRALDFCHSNNIVHRDLKPENVLVSANDVVKLCDFGFARFVNHSQDPFTDYVATRWYRAPELLVGDPQYGRAVDIWALGTLVVEMMTSEPMFAGESDLDQLYKITKMIGDLTDKQLLCLAKGSKVYDLNLLRNSDGHPGATACIQRAYPNLKRRVVDFVVQCLRMEPSVRPKSDQLLNHQYFTHDNFAEKFLPELENRIALENEKRPVVQKSACKTLIKDRFTLSPLGSGIQGTEWKFTPKNPDACSEQSELINVINFGRHSSSSLNLASGLVHAPSKAEEPPPPPHPSLQSRSFFPTPVYARKRDELRDDEKPGILRSSKLMARYRREMIPQTVRIVPVNGRLVMNENEKYVRDVATPKKPTAKDFCLPEIPGMDAKKRKQDNFLNVNECSCVPFITRTTSMCPLCNPLCHI